MERAVATYRGSETPLVSVIIPAYNAAQFIERTLRSVLNQTYSNLEVLVIDDGSTDATADIVQRFVSRDSRVAYFKQPNAGVAAARNYGIAKSKGHFIAPVDADDIWHATNIEKQVHLLANADDAMGMVYSWSMDIDEADCVTGDVRISLYHGNAYPALFYSNIVGNGSACLIRRQCFDTVGGYSSELLAKRAQGCEDWDIYLRIAEHYRVGVVPELLVGYRQVGGSMSTDAGQMTKSQRLAFQSVEKRFPKVCREVNRWAASVSHMYACGQYLNAHQNAQAWRAYRQALKNDALITLTTYVYWVILILLIMRSLSAWLTVRRGEHLSERQSGQVQRPSQLTSKLKRKAAFNRKKDNVKSKLASYFRIVLSPLFPAWLIRKLRMRWVSAQVSPNQAGPEAVSPWLANKIRVEIRLRSKSKNRRVDFGQGISPEKLQASRP